ncbi:unnamed protein product [Peniophora sp. CBMAI 1063]|nr:unnamed protein product [Peniophora sp. CBMAI 1063]
MSEQLPLPPGWIAEWNAEHQRWVFIDQATGSAQWEPPAPSAMVPEMADTPQPAQARTKRRQYAPVEQSQLYYNSTPGPTAPQSYDQPTPSTVAQGYFTPVDATQHAGQPGPLDYASTQVSGYNPVSPVGAYGVDQLANHLDQMGVQGARQQSRAVNLLTEPPGPHEPHLPPPAPQFPARATASQSGRTNAPQTYQRCTVGAFPANGATASKAKLPLALVINPYRSVGEGEEDVRLVNDAVIARCRRCRTYINPYVQFVDNNNRWKCCMCGMTNDVPQAFDWDVINNCSADRWARTELNYGLVDFVAPTEYMVRPPQPLYYVFLLDVSHAAVNSGMLATVSRTLLDNLDSLPNEDDRTKIALIGFDTALYFFHVQPNATDANMFVVADVDDVFLPRPPFDLLVNLKEAREALEALLDSFPNIFKDSTSPGSALGSALEIGFQLMAPVGGKLIVLSASLPTVGAGALKNREEPKVLGTPKESGLLQPASAFYKTFAIECSRMQVSVDMFLFGLSYQDIATLTCLPHYTSGQAFFYPAFNAARPEDSEKVSRELGVVLAMPIMVEAVTRVRVSGGLRTKAFHGNFFVRSTDLLAMPTVPQDNGYVVELAIEDTLPTPLVVMQTAILHTTAAGERRVRVITTAVPTTQNVNDVFASVDCGALAATLAARAAAKTLTHKLEDAREMLVAKVADILIAYKGCIGTGGVNAGGQLSLPENMRAFPLLILGLLKNIALRQSAQIPPDLRAWAQYLLTALPCDALLGYLHPNFYSLHNMPDECGVRDQGGRVTMPLLNPLSSERFERHGLFLIEDGQTMFLWVGRDAVPRLIEDVFGLPNYEALRSGKISLPVLENEFSARVRAVVQGAREARRGPFWPTLYLVKEDGDAALRAWSISTLIMDRADGQPSYQQFLNTLREKVHGSGY